MELIVVRGWGLLRVETATATASGFLWWKMKARYAFREVECAS